MPDGALPETTAGRVVAGLAALLVLGVLAGLALLWPDGSAPRRRQGPAAGAIENRRDVGSIGLIAAVPLTTAITALLASRLPVAAVPEQQHSH